ncbi:MAG: alpha/beta hydrolase family protein [Phycisphaerales bacterium]
MTILRTLVPAVRALSSALACMLAAMILAGCVGIERPEVLQAVVGDGEPAAFPSGPLDDAWKRDESWPRRWGTFGSVPAARGDDKRPARLRAVPMLGVLEEVRGRLTPMRRDDEVVRQVEQEMQLDIAKLIASRQGRIWTPTTVVGEGRGAFVFITQPEPERTSDRPAYLPAFSLKFISGGRGVSGAGETLQLQRTWLSFYDATTPPEVAPKGIAVVLPGIFGTPYTVVDQAVQNLRAQGWAVLRVLAHPSRFTERMTVNIVPGCDVEGLGGLLADVMGDRAAECAYAVEAASEYVLRQRPALRDRPRMALGMSGGAMVLPTVVALNPDAYCGAVMIAGGVDFLTITSTSNYAERIDALYLGYLGSAAIPEDVFGQLHEAYLARAVLDSRFTIRSLVGKPMLMVHAKGDQAVPASTGDELWERAGRPQRIVYGGGHETLFVMLPWQLDRVMQWVEATLPPRPDSGAAP